MAIHLSAEAHQSLWEARPSQVIDPSDWIQLCPPELGRGQRRWIQLRQGILLLIHDYELHQDLWLTGDPPCDTYPWLEFGFQLSEQRSDSTTAVDAAREWFLCANGLSDEGAQRPAGQRILQVDIHFTQPSVLLDLLEHYFDRIPSDIQELLLAIAHVPTTAAIPDSLIHHYAQMYQRYADLRLRLTPAIRLALQQCLACPHHSLTKHLYLESKALELAALALEQFVEQVADPAPNSKSGSTFRSDDVERLYQARDILQQNLENPPSLLTLARQVGLNDYKLKSGFRQVFNTTVFGYLRDCRLEQARQLLIERQLSVTEVCNTVGYASLSSFNTAFRKKFGYNPSACLKASWRSLPLVPLAAPSKKSVSSK